MLKKIFSSFLDIIYPKNCLLCKKALEDNSSSLTVCGACLEKSEKNVPPFCMKCGIQLKGNETTHNICKKCQDKPLSFSRGWSVFRYQGVIKRLLHLFKYKNKTSLRKVFGEILSDFVYSYNIPIDNFDLAVPVPMHNVRLREREYNQADLLAEELAKRFNLKLSKNNLRRVRNTKPQIKLNASSRWQNLQGAFAVKNKNEFENKNILLLDDLFTTGATTSAATEALKSAGAHDVSVLTLAIAK